MIEFQPGKKDKTFRIGTTLAKDHKEGLIEVIREFQDVFAWNPADMPGVDPQVALHKLHADPAFKLVKQKKRNFNEEKQSVIRREVEKLVSPKAIREIQFPEWIVNVVLVKKPNGDW